ncbi:hypothetical protein MED121_14999 [Marinomonas sp. MED121]|uniref:hypothetical protein n=1 Tax=Marinomonas sp. MED121 TaxID=314277 RepID=UPI000069105A|nr:hypothetical protein [Marinomonas sp. MED121]EAQ67245.1 hypothetical protein MED121_14999 [Marinomonas sp. MED121]
MFKNKHIVIALIVAPILALLAYFGVDNLVSEKPHKAIEGQSYPLVAKSNCRYTSGKCTFQNGNFEVNIFIENDKTLIVTSPYTLSDVEASILDNQGNTSKLYFVKDSNQGTKWSQRIISNISSDSIIRLVTIASKSIYYGESEMAFIDYETSFEEDFKRQD